MWTICTISEQTEYVDYELRSTADEDILGNKRTINYGIYMKDRNRVDKVEHVWSSRKKIVDVILYQYNEAK